MLQQMAVPDAPIALVYIPTAAGAGAAPEAAAAAAAAISCGTGSAGLAA
jgi:hypothetical protein